MNRPFQIAGAYKDNLHTTVGWDDQPPAIASVGPARYSALTRGSLYPTPLPLAVLPWNGFHIRGTRLPDLTDDSHGSRESPRHSASRHRSRGQVLWLHTERLFSPPGARSPSNCWPFGSKSTEARQSSRSLRELCSSHNAAATTSRTPACPAAAPSTRPGDSASRRRPWYEACA